MRLERIARNTLLTITLAVTTLGSSVIARAEEGRHSGLLAAAALGGFGDVGSLPGDLLRCITGGDQVKSVVTLLGLATVALGLVAAVCGTILTFLAAPSIIGSVLGALLAVTGAVTAGVGGFMVYEGCFSGENLSQLTRGVGGSRFTFGAGGPKGSSPSRTGGGQTR